MKSGIALDRFILLCNRTSGTKRVLDIGAGNGVHTRIMKQAGLSVETNDIKPSTHQGMYTDLTDIGIFDGIWASHVLEHQLNPGLFLKKIYNDLRDGGVVSITVPPRKDLIVGGHVTLWNAGLLLYNLILAGFNCANAAVATYGYNISVVLTKEKITLPALKYDGGDIDLLKPFFPKGLDIFEGFNGNIILHNWENVNINNLETPHFPLQLIRDKVT